MTDYAKEIRLTNAFALMRRKYQKARLLHGQRVFVIKFVIFIAG